MKSPGVKKRLLLTIKLFDKAIACEIEGHIINHERKVNFHHLAIRLELSL
jgi:hypothetical protein